MTQVAEAPEGSLAEPVLYPVAVTKNSQHQEEAQAFLDFLQSARLPRYLKVMDLQ